MLAVYRNSGVGVHGARGPSRGAFGAWRGTIARPPINLKPQASSTRQTGVIAPAVPLWDAEGEKGPLSPSFTPKPESTMLWTE